MKIRLANIIKESYVDGRGIRYVIFTQGCPHQCEGCHNSSTWSFDGGYLEDIYELKKDWLSNPLITGITISGGEPFSQPDEVAELCKEIISTGKNITIYTGYTLEDLIEKSKECTSIRTILGLVDVLIDGKFDITKKSLSAKFRGSSNQRAIDMEYYRNTNEVREYDFDN